MPLGIDVLVPQHFVTGHSFHEFAIFGHQVLFCNTQVDFGLALEALGELGELSILAETLDVGTGVVLGQSCHLFKELRGGLPVEVVFSQIDL